MSRQGIYIPLITPLDHNGKVSSSSVKQLMACSRYSAAGYLPCLTSGEGWLLSPEQWQHMLSACLQHKGEGQEVIVGIEQASTVTILEFAKQAQEMGANGIMVSTPFGTDVTQEDMISHYQDLHSQLDINIYLYNENVLSKNDCSMETLLAIAKLPNVVGIKDSQEQARPQTEISLLQAQGLKYYHGWEYHLACTENRDGCVVSLANIEPSVCHLATTLKNNDLQQLINQLTKEYSLLEEDWYRHVKQVLASRGVISTATCIGDELKAVAND